MGGLGLHRIRFRLRNYDSNYVKKEDHNSYKFNEAAWETDRQKFPITLIPRDFKVPPWWSNRYNIPFRMARRQLNDVRFIELTTPSKTATGEGVLELQKVVFQRKYISAEKLYLILLLLWLGSGIFYLLLRFTQLKWKADHDPLTRILNRSGLENAIRPVIEGGGRKGDHYSVIMIDIDFFKKVNDTLGHAAGDRVLKKISQIIFRRIRKTDVLCRWGGEEFLIFCAETTEDSAVDLAEDLRKLMEKNSLQITCSFGVAGARKGAKWSEIVKNADDALYISKNTGRNKVTLAEIE